jgi:hypothetical protein
MTTIGNESRPAYVYDAETDVWVPIGVGPHTHDEYIDKTIITAKGDLIAGSASESPAKLGVGADGTFLKADSSSPTGLVWEVLDAGSISVSETAPAEPGEGDLWFNSTNATTYIYYDNFWIELSPAIAGPRGEPGVVVSASEPSDTDVLWLDTDEESDIPVPAGGTTGQILAKTSADNYDTAWINPPSGNVIINGAFDIWQRGTSFTGITTQQYTADRWEFVPSGATVTITRESFTPDELNADVFGESSFYLKYNSTTSNDFQLLEQKIEDVRTLAGQTFTASFWAKGVNPSSPAILEVRIGQNFGSGGSAVVNAITPRPTLTEQWQKFTFTGTMPSIQGKTLGSNNHVFFRFIQVASQSTVPWEISIWGVQLEAGPVATPFKRNANSLQGELAACQRYYYRTSASASENFTYFGFGVASSTTVVKAIVQPKVSMRVAPTAAEFGGTIIATTGDGNNFTITGVTVDAASREYPAFNFTVASGLTTNRPYNIRAQDSSTAFVGFSAEL